MSNTDLIGKARAGDKQAFAALYIQYKDRLYRYAYFKLGSAQDAQDAVSNCIVEAYAGISLLKNEKAFSGWIFKILYRECCRILKENITRKTEETLSDKEVSSAQPLHLASELDEALKILTPEEKDIVLMSAVAGYKTREIAQILNINHATVRSKLSRSLSKMRNFLE